MSLGGVQTCTSGLVVLKELGMRVSKSAVLYLLTFDVKVCSVSQLLEIKT